MERKSSQKIKWETPKLASLSRLDRAFGDCIPGGQALSGDGLCDLGSFAAECADGTIATINP